MSNDSQKPGIIRAGPSGVRDENDQLVVGKVVPRKGIVAGPDGRGDCRRFPTLETEVISRLPGDDQLNPLEEMMAKIEPEVKETNPKDAVGIKKWRQFTTVPFTIIWELGVAMLEGARKYGRHNYRVSGVRASVYIDATFGHLSQWWEGEDNDPDTGLSHITKAMASLCVLRDAMMQGKFVDDRPPKTDVAAIRDNLQHIVDDVFKRIPEAKAAYLEGDQNEDK